MNAKSFLFVGAWMQPIKSLPLEQRWNVLEAIVEYSTSGEVTLTLDAMESLAFTFIRHEIDRMKEHRAELRETRRESANKRWKKDQKAVAQAKEEATIDANDANACKVKQADAPFISESVSVSESKPVSEKSTTTATCARVRGIAPISTLAGKVPRERKSRLNAISDGGTIGEDSKGMLGIGEYIDP